MTTRTGLSPQDLPADFAALLRSLRDVDNPLLNALLNACRAKGWKTPSLARGLGMADPAVGKRVQRARQHAAEAAAGDPRRAAEQQRITAVLAAHQIPDLPKVQAMIDGRQLDPEKIERLRGMQTIAARVNGARPADHPDRRISELLSALLAELVTAGFSPYYLAAVMGVSHRAITSRLERHHYRQPPPSVAGTSSGEYFGRKIGDEGHGAPRLTREEREELRAAWARYAAAGSERTRVRWRNHLARQLTQYRERGFSLANLAQAISTPDHRVRYASLQQVLAGARIKSPECAAPGRQARVDARSSPAGGTVDGLADLASELERGLPVIDRHGHRWWPLPGGEEIRLVMSESPQASGSGLTVAEVQMTVGPLRAA